MPEHKVGAGGTEKLVNLEGENASLGMTVNDCLTLCRSNRYATGKEK